MKRRMFFGLLLVVLVASPGICSQPNPDFSGAWKQSNERSMPRRTGNVTLLIDHRDSELTVETTVIRGFVAPRYSVQRYTTDGKVYISIGADGEEFIHRSFGTVRA